jgi:autotransporter-associated beta strand protein
MLRASCFRILIPTFALLALSAGQAHAQFYIWTAPGSGSWTNTANWTFGIYSPDYPQGSNNTAFFSFSAGGAGTVTLDAAITIANVNLSGLQTGALTFAPGTGGSLTLFSTNAQPGTLTVATGSGNHTISANTTLGGSATHEWNVGANRTFTVGGNIGGARGLTKLGTGLLLLNGTNTYSGATTVSAGTLGGRGSLSSAVTVGTGGTITAGTSPAATTLTLGNGLTLNGEYQVTLFSNTTSSRLVATSGLVSLTGGSLELALGSGVTVAGMRAAGPQSFTIIDAANNQLSGNFSTTNFTTAGFLASEWSVTTNPATGNATLNFTPVPEPAAVLGLAAGGLLAGCLLRRRLVRIAKAVEAS